MFLFVFTIFLLLALIPRFSHKISDPISFHICFCFYFSNISTSLSHLWISASLSSSDCCYVLVQITVCCFLPSFFVAPPSINKSRLVLYLYLSFSLWLSLSPAWKRTFSLAFSLPYSGFNVLCRGMSACLREECNSLLMFLTDVSYIINHTLYLVP